MRKQKLSESPSLRLPEGKSIALLAFAKPFHTSNSDDPEFYAVIGFRDLDGRERTTSVLAGQLVRKGGGLFEYLVNKGLPASTSRQSEIAALATASTDGRAMITFVPGWHGNVYVRPDKSFAPDSASQEAIRFTSHQAVKLGPFRRVGSLKSWKREVAYVGKHSSRARLFIALPFAGTVLRLINARSFGVVVVGVSSKGETLLLRLGASVLGHNGDQELTNLQSTPTAIQELMLGYRDGFLPLDELGLVEGDDQAVTAFMKSLSFMAATGRRKNRASAYEQAVKAIKLDSRVIIGITTEVSIAQIAARANLKRLRGEEVRLIEIPTARDVEGDIFDGTKADEMFGRTSAMRGKMVKRLELACEENQGVAHRVFLSHLVKERMLPIS